ncbi:MAG: choice-of-anchor K domain-containing protein [Candidatus Dojkabacteria bacterium]
MKLNKKLLKKSLYKISTVLFLIGYTFTPPFLAFDQLRDIGGEITPVAAADGPYTISSTSGIWTKVEGTTNYSGVNTSEIRWGTGNPRSGLKFTSAGAQTFDANQKFLIGDLTHMNWPVSGGTADSATLKVTLNFSQPPLSPNPTFSYKFNINETSNGYSWYKNCPGYPDEQLSTTPCDDVITFPSAYGQEVFTIGDMKYTLKIDGFQSQYPTGDPVSKFITEEKKDNVAYLVGHLSSILVEKPAISIVKKVNGQDANTPAEAVEVTAGETVNFEYIVQNTGNVKLTNIAVTDDKGVQVTCPGTELEPGTNMTCTGSATAIAGDYTNIGTVTSSHDLSASDPANYKGIIPTIRICHASGSHTNPYIVNNPSASGDLNGHAGHTGPIWFPGITVDWGDIIPSFTSYDGVYFPGLNWSEYGQAVYNNNCVIPQGKIIVKKVLSPASTSNQAFEIVGSGTPAIEGSPTFLYYSNSNIGSISRNQSHTYNVMPGTYNIAETVPAGWSLVSNTCSNIEITNNETKECTITNTQHGSLTIVKRALPYGNTSFGFKLSGNGVSEQFNLVDNSETEDASKTFSLTTGTYAVAEDDYSADWKTTHSCTKGSIDNIALGAGESVTCTFTNTKYGSISGYKLQDADNDDSTTTDRTPVSGWTIILKDKNGTEIARTTTNVNGYYEFTGLLPADYIVTEGLEVGWIVLVGDSKNVTLDAGENEENVNFVNVKLGSIKVLKNVDTDGDGDVDQEGSTEWSWTLNGANAGATGTTKSDLEPGSYTIKETGGLDNFHFVSLSCTGAADERITITDDTATIDLRSGEDVVCTYTNARNLGKLIIEKEVINDNGGSKKATDFSFQIDSEDAIQFTKNGENELLGRNEYVRYAGLSYTITEPEANQDGYTTTYRNCEDIVVPHDGEVVCKITNNDSKPSLTLVKEVKNDNGGTAVKTDWNLKADGPTPISGDGGATSGDDFQAGTYILSESGDVAGYNASDWSCTNGVVVDDNNGITIGIGQSTVCTIVNDDIAPSLQLVKVVNNNFGGNAKITDWALTATGPTTITGNGGVTSGDTFKAGTYTLSESGDVTGYDASSWSCTNGITVDANNGITLGVGESTVCTITNSDIQPTLTLVKTVVNKYGGNKEVSDFNLYIGDTKVTSGVATGVNANTQYTVREDQLDGYTASDWSGDCSADGKITLLPGENKTCTITNSDSQSKITVIKKVVNDNGGTATANDFNITLTDSTLTFDAGVKDGDTTTYTASVFGDVNKEYTLSETVANTGYTMDSLECSLGSDGVFTLPEGQDVTCTIVNNDIQPKLTVVKVVDNETYGNKEVSDFTLYVSGNKVTSGDVNNLDAGEYTVSEDNIDGYEATITGDCDVQGKVTLNPGDDKTCTITNRSTHGKIVIKKLVEPDTDSTEFTFTGDVAGTIGHNGTIEKIVVPGEYSVAETSLTGWNLKSLVCDDTDSSASGYTARIKVGDNETVTCTFTNEKLGKISGYKYEDKNGNGIWDAEEPALDGWTINNGLGDSTTTNASGYYEFTSLPVGNTYTITETQKDGWTQTSTNPSAITIVAGDDVKDINFGNFKHVTINVTKDVVGIDGVTDVEDDRTFTAQLNGGNEKLISETTTATYTIEQPGTYTVSEFDVVDYTYLGCFLGDVAFTDYAVESGKIYNVVCKNAQLPATVIVTKNVVNSDGVDEDVFSDDQFDVVLGEETKQIADTANGKVLATFEGLQPGEYTLTETEKDGYIFEGCTNSEGTLGSNETVEVVCTNRVIDPLLEIEKSNDKEGIDQYAGDEVTYTIKVTAPSDELDGTYVLNNVVISDIAPAGFEYISDTWTAQKNGVDIIVPEPTYDGENAAQWIIGDMKEGDEVVLTYKTKISLLTDPGVYPDIAWVKGASISNLPVLGNVSTDASTPFVGTEVKVIEPIETEDGEVLGAISYLPKTGADTYLTLGALAMVLLGLFALLSRPFKKLKYALLTTVMAFSILSVALATEVLAEPYLDVKIEKPVTPTAKKSFNIDFTAQSTSGETPEVDCYKDAVKFASFTANSGACPVTVTESGTYSFYVVATAGGQTEQSETVTVVVDLTSPSPVTGYSKSGNVLTFTTANDGRTSKVEIFRSDKSSFTANASTRLDTMNVSPNTTYTYTDGTAVAGNTYYYALRAVDAYGNVSTLVSDNVVIVVKEPATTTTTNVAKTETSEVEGATDEDKDSASKEVKGETDDSTTQKADEGKESNETNDSDSDEKKSFLSYWYIWVPVLIVSVGLVYLYVRREKKSY